MQNTLKYLQFSEFMQKASIIALKEKAYPNPNVAAILIDQNNQIKGMGVHKGPGTDHAEIDLIKKCNIESTDTLYITLEPCFHSDTSPSCAEELLKTDLKNLVIGDIDVDERTNGKSINKLKNEGVEINIEKGINDFINPHYKSQKLYASYPYIIGKLAISQNNKIYDLDKKLKYISNEDSLKLTHLIRASVDAILIGKNTLITDLPKLNIRYQGLEHIEIKKIILWGTDSENIEKYASEHKDFIFITDFEDVSNNVVNIKTINKTNIINFLQNNSISSLLVEGGNKTLSFFFENNLINKFYLFKSDKNIMNGIDMNIELNGKLSLNNEYKLNENILEIYT